MKNLQSTNRIDLTEGPILNILLKLDNAAVETAVGVIWLKHELAKVRSSFIIIGQPAELKTV